MENKNNPESSGSNGTSPQENNPSQFYSVSEIKELFFKRIAELAAQARAQGFLFCQDHMEKYVVGKTCQICDVLKSIK